MASVSHRCNFVLAGGQRCKLRIADPSQAACRIHPGQWSSVLGTPVNVGGTCEMVQVVDGQWTCLTHTAATWEIAIALGAAPPCRIPLTRTERLRLARDSERVALSTALLLARDASPRVKGTLAANPRCPVPALAILCEDERSGIASAALAHPDCPAQQLRAVVARLLATHHTRPISMRGGAIAMNPATPVDLLRQLLQPTAPPWGRWALANPACPEELLRQRASDPQYLSLVASNERCPPDLLSHMAEHASKDVLRTVIKNQRTPEETLRRLANSPDKDIAKQARRALRGAS